LTQIETAGPDVNAARQRAPRVEVKRAERRRRKAGTLNRMAQFKLDIFDDKQLDTKNYVYRWVDDEGSRLRQATKGDDYDFVTTGEIGDFDPDSTDSESTERLRQISGTDKHGHPTYTYLLRKPREYFDEDMIENCQFREDVMEQRVYQGEETTLDPDDDSPEATAMREATETFYAARGNTLGGPNGGRRRGALARK
jgi:hypothetical protein